MVLNTGRYLEIFLLFFPCSKTRHIPWPADLYLSVYAKLWNTHYSYRGCQETSQSLPSLPPFHTFYSFTSSFIRSFIHLTATN